MAKPRRRKGSGPTGRAGLGHTPIAVFAQGDRLGVDDLLVEYVRDRLDSKLGKFSDQINRISVRFADESGPKGAPTIRCRIITSLTVGESVTVESQRRYSRPAFDEAADAHERAVRRLLERRVGRLRRAARR